MYFIIVVLIFNIGMLLFGVKIMFSFENQDKVFPVFVPALSHKVLYAFQIQPSNGFIIYDLDSLKEDDDFIILNSLGWCSVDGTKKIEGCPYPIQFAYPATQEMFELIDETQMYLNENWKVNWHLRTVELVVHGYKIKHRVVYKFISEDTIKCIDLFTFKTFFTSYKSLTV